MHRQADRTGKGRVLARLLVVGCALLGFAGVTVVASTGAAFAAAARHHRHHRRHHHRRHRRRAAGPAQPSGVAGPCPNAGTSVTAASAPTLRGAVVCLINLQRNERGLPGLNESSQLDNSAENWTNVMVATQQLTHGTNLGGRISAAGYNWQAAGENIASGYSTPYAVVSAWMADPMHCQNILSPSFRDVGVGASGAAIDGATSPGTWAADFGLWMLQSAPSGNWGPANGCPY